MPTQKDPTTFGYQNFFSTTLTGDITAGTLTIGLATVPTPTSGILVIEPDSTSAREIILYTSKGASTVTCPSDGRGWSGSTAAPHLQGSTVIMAPVDEWFEGLADGTLSTDPSRTILLADHIVSGGVVAQSSGLIGTFSNIVFYLSGQRYSGTSIANKTYTASKDTYVDVTATSGGTVSVTYSEVANGAASPALAANSIRVAKVVTNGSAITSVSQGSVDSLNNQIYPQSAAGNNAWLSYTPVLTGISASSNIGRYIKQGKTCTAMVNVTFSGAGSGTYVITLPFTVASGSQVYVGQLWGLDSGTAYWVGTATTISGTNTVNFTSNNTGNQWGALIPFTWAVNDIIRFQITYEIA